MSLPLSSLLVMFTSLSATSMNLLQKSNDFTKVLEYHVECIYKCGLLLDEHDELLQELLRLPQLPKTKVTFFPVASVICGSCLTIKLKSSVPIIVFSIPLALSIFNRYLAIRRCSIYNKNFAVLTSCFRKIYELNKCIVQYYQRKKVSLAKVDQSTRILIEKPVILKLSEFMQFATKTIWDIVLVIKNKLRSIKETFNLEQFGYVYDLNIPEDIKSSDSEEEIMANFELVQMCFVFAVSTILCGIGFCFSHIDFKNEKHLSLFTIIIPDCFKITQNTYQKLLKEYEKVSYRLPNVTETVKKAINSSITPIKSALSSLNENLILSFNTITAVQAQITIESDLSEYKNQLNYLNCLLLECMNTLTDLQYETNKSQINNEVSTEIKRPPVEDVGIVEVIRYDDVENASKDEEYTLSTHGSDSDISISDDQQSKLDYEQLRKQIKNQRLIIKELNIELKKRQLIKQIDVPDQKNGNGLSSKESTPENTQIVSKLDIPPPPLPTFFAETTSAPPPRDLLEQIRFVAQSRGVEEVTFGDSFSSDDEESGTSELQ